MSSENSPIDLAFCPKLDIPTAQEIVEIVAQIPDEETRGCVEFAIESKCVGELPDSGLSEDAFSKLESFIGGVEIADISLSNANAMVGIELQILAFAREDGSVEYRCEDDTNSGEPSVLATLTEPPTLGEMIDIVIQAIEDGSEYSWRQMFCGSFEGEIDYGANGYVSSEAYPQLSRWFEEEIEKYIEECESDEEDDEDDEDEEDEEDA